ncbi:MAG: helix-turn-helix domain-containing protein [Acidobacteriota bacterium]|nr:helix-turn-helix domain-containing protein [Acidobacteriota bacterium]
MRLPIDTATVKFAAAGPAEPVLDYETRTPKLDENGVALFNVPNGRIKFDRALTIREAADVLGVSYATARRLVLQGKITYQRVSPRRIVVRESALTMYLDVITRIAPEVQ